jgi:peptidoglycan-N-acetylglucosamine deacetylase
MGAVTYITTSWDDGHPLDGRVAELLTKYGLRGTFYVPMAAETGTMSAAQVRELSAAFEVGAHTLHHVDLTGATEAEAWEEIAGSKSWVEDSTGRPCPLFCPPRGRFAYRHLRLIRRAGYVGVRGVELLSTAFPGARADLLLLPTTVQAYPHGLAAYARNGVKRAAFRPLWRCLTHCRSADWAELARSLLRAALTCGGVFHLWGHSWEIERAGLWQRLEEVLRYTAQFTGQAPALTNSEVLAETMKRGATR